MSTRITSTMKTGTFALSADTALVGVEVGKRGVPLFLAVLRDDFLAAVETELGIRCVPADALVIEQSELPSVEPLPSPDMAGRSVFVNGAVYDLDSTNPDYHRAVAMDRLALAEYLTAHPPVPPVSDEDVETLAELVRDALGVTPETIAAGHLRQGTSDDVARRLLAAHGPNGERLTVTR